MIRYLYQSDIPVLLYEKKRFLWKKWMKFKWKNELDSFNLPILVNQKKLTPQSDWKSQRVKNLKGMRKQFDWRYALYEIEEIKRKDK